MLVIITYVEYFHCTLWDKSGFVFVKPLLFYQFMNWIRLVTIAILYASTHTCTWNITLLIFKWLLKPGVPSFLKIVVMEFWFHQYTKSAVTVHWPETQTGDAAHNTRNKECCPHLVCDVKISREVFHLCYIATLDQDSFLFSGWIYKTACLQVMLPSVVHQVKCLHKNVFLKVSISVT